MAVIAAHPFLTAILLCLMTVFLGFGSQPTLAGWLPLIGIPAAVLIGIGLWYKNAWNDRRGSLLLLCMGFCMRLAYVLATPCTARQHDVGEFGGDSGHAAYITYLYKHLHLPDFDVREVWQFYHPPVHHILSAAWMRFLTACGLPFEQAGESVQILTLTYSCLCMVIFLQILQHFNLKGWALLLPLAVIAFHPTFFILAGSINNDMLSITFMMASVLLTLRWFREPKLSTILKLALTIGLGMMTKLSAWMVAPAAAMAFLIILYRNRRQCLTYIKQYVLFGIVCVPLGLGWGIRNLLRWGVPITYVPMLSDDSAQFVGDIPLWQRLFDLHPKQWLYVYDCFVMYGQEYNEYNPLFGLLKTAMFDELINPAHYPSITGFGELLFYSNFLLVIASVAAILAVWLKKGSMLCLEEKGMLSVTYGITLISYYSFCIAFAHVCTQNIRYATPLIFIGALFLGFWMQQTGEGKKAKILRYLLTGVTVLFMLGSYLVYACVCR